MFFGKSANKQAVEEIDHPAQEMRDFTRRETDIRPYRVKLFRSVATGTALGGNPVEFLQLALKGKPIPLEVPLEAVNKITGMDNNSTSLTECLDDLGIMRPLEIQVLREAEKMDSAVNDRIHRDRAIRLIAQYHQWSAENRTSSELAYLFCRMSLLSVFFPHPLVMDAIKGDPFLMRNFGEVTEEPESKVWETMGSLNISEFYVAVLRLAEERGKLPKGFELLANIERNEFI
jgi:hypothetical protein